MDKIIYHLFKYRTHVLRVHKSDQKNFKYIYPLQQQFSANIFLLHILLDLPFHPLVLKN
jgi:hypothetical protein